jgi:hypothetical protein
MSLTARQLNRATLGRQMLLRRAPLTVVEAVSRVVALQAQEAASPYIALWNRLSDFDPADLDAAFADRTVAKASLIRVTLHAVLAEDYSAFHTAMVSSLRASRLYDHRFNASGLTIADADALLPHLLEFTARARTKAQIEAMLATRLGERNHPRAWWALRTFAPLHHAPTGRPWSFGATSAYVAAGTKRGAMTADEAVQRIVLRYLEAFGPASAQDFAQFTILRQPVVQAALAAVSDRVVRLEGPDGATLFDVPGGWLPEEDTPAPARLLPMWDNTMLAYSDRSRVIPPEYRRMLTQQNGDVLPSMLVDGYVCGIWRPVEGGIEATAFRTLSDDAWEALAAEARALVAFLAGRDPAVYRRYAHWWAKLPSAAEVRLLPG